jgi:hypothetical protein
VMAGQAHRERAHHSGVRRASRTGATREERHGNYGSRHGQPHAPMLAAFL